MAAWHAVETNPFDRILVGRFFFGISLSIVVNILLLVYTLELPQRGNYNLYQHHLPFE